MASVDKYANYTAIELATDAAFISWVKCPDAANDLFWKEYVNRYPSQTTAVDKARILVGEMRLVDEAMEEDRAAIVWNKIVEKIHRLPVESRRANRYVFMGRWWSAAAVVGLIVLGMWFLISRQPSAIHPEPGLATTAQDISPGGDKAVLTLADGTKVVLDTATNGALSQQGGVTIIKLNDGQLAYNESSKVSPQGGDLKGAYNTITTPRGGQYQ